MRINVQTKTEHTFEIGGGRLLVPFLIWSLFYSGITLIQTILKGGEIDVVRLIYHFLIGKASTPLYYIVVLLQLTILAPMLVKAIQNHNKVYKWFWMVTPVYLIWIYIFNFATGKAPLLYGTLFPAWFIFFYLGLVMKQKQDYIHRLVKRFARPYWILFAFVFELIEACLLLKIGCNSNFASSQIKISSFLYSFAIILYLLNKVSKREDKIEIGWIRRFMNYVGNNSYGIFYVHCFILMIVTRLLVRLGLSSNWFIYFLLCWIFTVIISLLCIKSVRAISFKIQCNRIIKWVGFN